MYLRRKLHLTKYMKTYYYVDYLDINPKIAKQKLHGFSRYIHEQYVLLETTQSICTEMNTIIRTCLTVLIMRLIASLFLV